jgi:para-nitrobenzyl esterase
VWFYRFSYVAESLRGQPGWEGTPHGMEIPYVFNIPGALVGERVTEADRRMAEAASGYWVAFARGGNPNGAGRPEWPRHDPAVDRIIDFTNDGVTVGPDPIKPRLDLWEKVFDRK